MKYQVVNLRSITIFLAILISHCCVCIMPVYSQVQRCKLSEVSVLQHSDGDVDDYTGYAVSIYNNIAVVGVPQWSSNYRYGKVYIYRHNGLQWIEEEQLTPPDGDYNDEFGYSLSQSTNRVVVGSLYDDDMGVDSGSVYIFIYNQHGNGKWDIEAKITAPDGSANDNFGRSVYSFGDVLVVGAMNDDDTGTDSGSVYIFRYDRDNTQQWILEEKITASDGDNGDRFGYCVSAANDVIAVGTPYDNGEAGNDIGSTYIFRYDRDDSKQWLEEAKITPEDGIANDYFGCAVSINNNLVVIGADNDNNINGKEAGSAYIFRYNRNEYEPWLFEAKLLASNGHKGDNFGHAVSVYGKNVVVGAINGDDEGINTGTAYIFRNNPFSYNHWTEVAKLQSTNNKGDDKFGNSVAVSNDKVVIGAPYNDDNNENSGMAYVFDVDCPVLTVSPKPLIAGQYGTFTVTNTKSFRSVYLAGTVFGMGETFVPVLDVTLDLNRPIQIGNAVISDKDGNAQWTIFIDERARGINIWIQAVQYCLKTNVVATSIQ